MPKNENNGTSKSGSSKSTTQAQSKSGSARGFAAMDPEMQRKIASKGGKASHGGTSNKTDKK